MKEQKTSWVMYVAIGLGLLYWIVLITSGCEDYQRIQEDKETSQRLQKEFQETLNDEQIDSKNEDEQIEQMMERINN